MVEDGSFDYVIGFTQPIEPSLKPDLTIDLSVLEGRLGDGTLRDFEKLEPDDLFLIGSTTGTTGDRKLIAQTVGYTQAVYSGRRARDWFVGRVMVTLGALSYYGFNSACAAFDAGSTFVRSAKEALHNLKLINGYQVNSLLTTPNTLQVLLNYMEENNIATPDLKTVRLTGSLFSPELVRRARRAMDVEMTVGYGTTEYGGISSGTIPEEEDFTGYVGRVRETVKFSEESINSADFTKLVIDNSDGMAKSYYEKGQILPQSDRYELPDIGVIRDGILYLAGRADEVFNWGGNKVSFARIEAEIAQHPDVSDVGVVGGAVIGNPKIILIGVVAGEEYNFDVMQETALQKLNLHKAGEGIVMKRVEYIPRNDMEKIDRPSLASLVTGNM